MIIGILKETLGGEARVAATPETVKKMILLKNDVLVQEGAGDLAAIPDKMFVEAGASISNRSNVLKADLI